MKKIIIALSLVFSFSAFAQNSSVTDNARRPDLTSKGFYIGVDYMKLILTHSKDTYRDQVGEYNTEGEVSEDENFAGFRLGYSSTPISGIGYEAGFRFLQHLSDEENEKTRISILELNAILAMNHIFIGYVGINGAIFGGSSVVDEYKADVGGQVGLGLRLTSDLTFSIGYTVIRQKIAKVTPTSDSDSAYQFDNYNSNLTYTF